MSDVKFLSGPGSEEPTTSPHSRNKRLTYAIEGAILVLALMLGLLIRLGVYETAIVTSDSMLPALTRGDRLLIDHRQSLRGQWKRGDIVIFEPPAAWSNESESYVKRVIGLPGEVVEMRAGQVLINGRLLQEKYLDEVPAPQFMRPLLLPPGYYWIMGDNRNNSFDSRSGGPLPSSSIHGRAVYRLGPWGRTGALPPAGY